MLKLQTLDDFRIILKAFSSRQMNYSVQKSANKAFVFSGNRKRAAFYNPHSELKEYFKDYSKANVINQVHAQVRKFIKIRDFKIHPVKPIYPPVFRDTKGFKELPNGTELIVVDINHAYWRIAYNLGYINKTLYKKYANDPEYKLARNIAMSMLSSDQEREIYCNGVLVYTINCLKNLEKVIYTNIRQRTYNIIGELAELFDTSCLSYRVDGLTLLNTPEAIEFCKVYFKKKKVTHSVKYYKKYDNLMLVENNSGEMKKL